MMSTETGQLQNVRRQALRDVWHLSIALDDLLWFQHCSLQQLLHPASLWGFVTRLSTVSTIVSLLHEHQARMRGTNPCAAPWLLVMLASGAPPLMAILHAPQHGPNIHMYEAARPWQHNTRLSCLLWWTCCDAVPHNQRYDSRHPLVSLPS